MSLHPTRFQGAIPAAAAPCALHVRSSPLLPLSRRAALNKSLPTLRNSKRSAKGLVRAEAEYRYPIWDYMWRQLVDNIKSVSADEAIELTKSGKYVLVDVRACESYEEAHAEGALNAPLFQKLNWSSGGFKILKGVAYLVNGVSPVEPNENFIEDMKKITDTGKGVIMYCEAGGTLSPSTNFMTGKTSRSLKAAYRVLDAKLTDDVLHLDGGLYGYFTAGKPIIGEYNKENAGKTPNVAKAPEGDFITKE